MRPESGPFARTAARARASPGTRRDVFRSRLQRAGLFAFGAFLLRDPSALQGSGTVMALAGFSRRFLGAEVALPLAQLAADPDEVEEAVQQGIAGQAFLSKSSEQELMQ
jgi:hypothetical protein